MWGNDLLKHRMAVVVPIGAASDVTITMSPTDDKLWTALAGDTSGYGFRLTAGDGVSAVPYDLESSYSLANRTVAISCDDPGKSATYTKHLWLYYGMDTPTNGAAALTIAAAANATVHYGNPELSPYIVDARDEPPGAQGLGQALQATAEQQILVWFRIPRARATSAHEGVDFLEEVDGVKTDSSGLYTSAGVVEQAPGAVYAIEIGQQYYIGYYLDLTGIAAGTYNLRLKYRTHTYAQIANVEQIKEARCVFTIVDFTT